MITKEILTKSEAIALGKGESVYPEKISPLKFHVDYDGIDWLCYQNEEGDKTNDLTKTKFVPIFSADWDGVSPNLTILLGSIPKNGVPFQGWPQS